MEGWIKLHRKMEDWEWSSNPVILALFIHLLLMANYEEKRWQGILIPVGSFITSIVKLSVLVGVSQQKMRTALKKLESTGEISMKSTNRFTMITVCKYDSYQSKEDTEQQTNNKRITNKQQTNNKQITNKQQTNNNNIRNKEIKNIRSKEYNNIISKKFIKPTLLEIEEYCKERNNDVDAGNFFDYNESKGWIVGKAPMKDWRAAVRTWERNNTTNNRKGTEIPKKPNYGTGF
jgi:E3 ubiquitin-protein ligase DOA10